jgi:hypothetical protein
MVTVYDTLCQSNVVVFVLEREILIRSTTLLKEILDVSSTSIVEYTMAIWKQICDRAMSKWRPYSKNCCLIWLG